MVCNLRVNIYSCLFIIWWMVWYSIMLAIFVKSDLKMPKTSWTVSVCKTTNIFEFGRMVLRWRWTAHNGFILILDGKLFLLLHFSYFRFRLLDISESALPTHLDNEFGGNSLIFGHFVLAAVNSYDNSAVWLQEEQLQI